MVIKVVTRELLIMIKGNMEQMKRRIISSVLKELSLKLSSK